MIKKFGGDEENRTPDPLLARQVLSQLSYTPTDAWLPLIERGVSMQSGMARRLSVLYSVFRVYRFALVGLGGLEPPTSRLSGVRSNHLSYAPMFLGLFTCYPHNPFPGSCGGDEEDRTPDPLLARQVLSQLSYTPK